MLPDGFDFNDVRFYTTLVVMLALAVMTWRLRRVAQAQDAADRQLGLERAASRTDIVGEARPATRVRA